jgi:SAM-dependent methyltransferase
MKSFNAAVWDMPCVPEIYDQGETWTDDVVLIRRLVSALGQLRILEPFCGTGRIFIPLAIDGHELVGIDQAHYMLEHARSKILQLPAEGRHRITLMETDVIRAIWPEGFDVVILGGNCFYELASPEEQEQCIIYAAKSLKLGGYVYVDNDHMEGDLDPSWRKSGIWKGFPTGTCADGTRVESLWEVVWFDIPLRLIKYRRQTRIIRPDGTVVEKEYMQQKHPVSAGEVQHLLDKHGFVIERFYGDHIGNPCFDTSERAIFWARKS